LDELDAALLAGFDARHAILNGPAKWRGSRQTVTCWAVFNDSAAELRQLERKLEEGFLLQAGVVGVRFAPLGIESRFGLRITDAAQLADVADLVSRVAGQVGAEWGVHFHHAESMLGPQRWAAELASVLQVAARLAAHLGPPAIIDLGGGWHPSDLDLLSATVAAALAGAPRILLADSPAIVLEPGKLLTEPAGALISRVLLSDSERSAVVVDASICDLPEAVYRQHPVARLDDDVWRPFHIGAGMIYGRSCMEQDVLVRDVDVVGLKEGQLVAFGECGAYDSSMAYDFGRGVAL
jgi:diaminopimelate decarboxylase